MISGNENVRTNVVGIATVSGTAATVVEELVAFLLPLATGSRLALRTTLRRLSDPFCVPSFQ